ncbi:B12-binding domain-containing radical SAM protein [Thermodesulfobacteriota bacterium]
MNVLLINPEFPVSFWSYPEACRLLGVKALFPPLGLITVAALLPRDWKLILRDLNTCRLREEDWSRVDLVMISAMLVQRDGMLAMIREAKRRGITVVAGGPYPTSMPDEVLDAGCDFLVMGEAEPSISSFLSAFRQGESKGVFTATQKPEMSTSPVPRFELLRLEDYANLAIQTSRGCPYDCEFCDIVNLFGRTPRYKTPDQIIEELGTIYRLGWRGPVFICDDNFIGNRKHARSILNRLTPWMETHGKPFVFTTQTTVDLGQDLEMIDLMTEANFSDVFVGIESPDEDVLALSRKYQNIRNPLAESLDNINRNGLSVMGSFIIGFDGEKRGAGDRICSFVDRTSIPVVMLNTLQAPPNTRLWERLAEEGRLLQGGFSCEGYEIRQNFIPMRPASEIIDEYLRAVGHLYEPSRYLERCYRYILSMRPTRAALAAQRGQRPPKTSQSRSKPPLKTRLRDVRVFLHLVWRHGVRAPHREQFWKQLVGVARKNPSRLIKYLNVCAIGENMFRYRETVTGWARERGKVSH